MICTNLRIREVDEQSLVSHPLPSQLCDPAVKEWEYLYYLPNMAVKFTHQSKTGCLSVYPYGVVWCYGGGRFAYMPSPPPVYAATILHRLVSTRADQLDADKVFELGSDLAEIVKAVHLNLIVNHPTHFPEWWPVRSRNRRGKK